MIRGLGYLQSLSDLETVPVGNKNGTPVLVRDLGTVSFGPISGEALPNGMAKARPSAASW